MPIDAKLRSQYQSLANEYLYNFPVRSETEFPLIARALGEVHHDFSMGSAYRMAKKARNFFNSYTQVSPTSTTFRFPTMSTEIKSRISSLEGILSSPQSYVASSRDYAEYRRIVLSCVNAMQTNLQNMTPEDKSAYVEEQDRRRAQVAAQKEVFSRATAPKPGDEGSTTKLEVFVAEKAISAFKSDRSVRRARQLITSEYEKASSVPGDEFTQALREQLLSEGLYENEEIGENLLNRLTGNRQPTVEGQNVVVSQEVLDEFLRDGVPPELLNM